MRVAVKFWNVNIRRLPVLTCWRPVRVVDYTFFGIPYNGMYCKVIIMSDAGVKVDRY